MNLQPVRFINAEDIMSFIERFHQSGHLTLETKDNQQKITSVSEQFETLFLRSGDGSTYLLEDVQKFLQEASDADIAATKASFVIEKKDKTVTLAQIKADSTLYDQIKRGESVRSSITGINLTIYSYTALPSLKTIENIKAAKKVFDNSNWHQIVTGTSTCFSFWKLIASPIASLIRRHAEVLPKVEYQRPFDRTNLDFMTISLTQEAKLKAHLVTQRDLLSNKQEIDELNQWISELDKNNEETKALLQDIMKFFNKQWDAIKPFQTKYNELTQNDLSPEELQQQKNALIVKAGRKSQLERLEKKVKLYKVLTPIAIYGSLIGLPLLLTAALLTVTLLFVPLLLPLTLLIIAGLFTLTKCFIAKKIEDKFSLYHDSLHDEFVAIAQKSPIELKMDFVEQFSPIAKDLELFAMECRAIVETIEADLQEIALVEAELQEIALPEASEPLNKKSEVPSLVSSQSLFKVTKMKELSDPAVVDFVEDKVKTDTSETSCSYQ